MPVVALGDAWFGNVNRDLAALRSAQELGERAALVDIGPEAIGEVPRLVVGQERAPELLGEGALHEVGHRQRLAAVAECAQQVDDLAQRLHVGPGDVAEPVALDAVEALVATTVFLAEQGAQHLVDKVVDVEELQLHRGVVDGVGASVGDGVAEGGHGGVVARAAPLAVQVGEAVDEHRRPGAFRVLPEQALPRELRLAVYGALEASRQARLRGAGEHDGASVAVALERLEQRGGEPEVALHELGLLLGAVDAGQVEDEIGAGAIVVELLRRGVDVVLHDLERKQARVFLAAVLTVPYIFQCAAEVLSDKALSSGYENAHSFGTAMHRKPLRLQEELARHRRREGRHMAYRNDGADRERHDRSCRPP